MKMGFWCSLEKRCQIKVIPWGHINTFPVLSNSNLLRLQHWHKSANVSNFRMTSTSQAALSIEAKLCNYTILVLGVLHRGHICFTKSQHLTFLVALAARYELRRTLP